MFADAFKIASLFTYPVIASRRRYDGTTECSCAAFIVLNKEGWIVTAAHLLASRDALERSGREIAGYFARIHALQAVGRISDAERSRRIFRLKPDPRWLTQLAFWWGRDGVRAKDVRLLPEADLAVARLEPFDARMFRHYPVLKDPSRLDVGTSLCKLGFPFNRVRTAYDDTSGEFRLRTGPLPLEGFPTEGIYTRTVPAGNSACGRYEIKFVETSSPGLVGQSGGPLFDTRGVVWGVQSRTEIRTFRAHVHVGPNALPAARLQSLKLGLAVHPEPLVAFLRDQGIRFRLSEYEEPRPRLVTGRR